MFYRLFNFKFLKLIFDIILDLFKELFNFLKPDFVRILNFEFFDSSFWSQFHGKFFNGFSIDFQLASDISEVKAMSLLKESEESMQKLVRSTKNNIESREHQEALAVCSRLKFYRHFFLALSYLAKQDINDAMRYFAAHTVLKIPFLSKKCL